MTGFSSRLDALQEELLKAFGRREPRFVLSGGAALAGYHLGHRETKDLDFFCGDLGVDLQRIGGTLGAAAASIGADLELLESSPYFRRYLVRRGAERTRVDLVLDGTSRVAPPEQHEGILVDSLMEIAANKLCALVGRAEIRDLIDLVALLDAGIDLEEALRGAQLKEGGVDAATLAWLLDEIHLADTALIPGGGPAAALNQRRAELVRILRRLAFPSKTP